MTLHENPSSHTPRQILLSTAHQLTQVGISVVAATTNKTPVGGKWGHLKKRIATDSELSRLFNHPKAEAIALIGGRVSGNLITLDFEGKDHNHEEMPSVYPQWEELVKDELERLGLKDLFFTLPIVRTQNHGYHVHWRVSLEIRPGNESLAKRWAKCRKSGALLQNEHGAPIADLLIESKGEGA